MRQTDGQTDTAHHFIMPPPYGGWGIIMSLPSLSDVELVIFQSLSTP